MDSSNDQCVVVQTQEFRDWLILDMDELNIALSRHDDLYRLAFKFSSDAHILIPFEAITIPIIVFNKGHVQLHTFDVPEVCSAGKEGHA